MLHLCAGQREQEQDKGMKKKQRLLTSEELWDIEAKHPFSAGNPKSLLAWAAVRSRPARKRKTAAAKVKVPV